MKILGILERLSEKQFEFSESKSVSRRETIFSIGSSGKTILKTALPLGVLASLDSSAQGGALKQGSAGIVDVLNFALTLEHLEAEFYTLGLNSTVIPAGDKTVFNQIKKHEVQHVAFLQTTITALGGTPVAKPTFDFTAKGKFDPFNKYAEFLALAQAFEDTGVRAYKGQAGNLMSNDDVLTAALQIHSVEARHASQVRRLRTKLTFDDQKGWISGNYRGTLPVETQAVYAGEENTMHAGADAVAATTVGIGAVQEAFDEPLTDTQTLAIASLFLA